MAELDYQQNKTLEQLQIYAKEEALKVLENDNTFLHKYTDQKQLIRLLIARNYDLQQAKQMWMKWVQWRQEFQVDNIQERSIFTELRSGKAFLHGFDKYGNPCIIVKLKNHQPAQSNITEVIRFFVYLMEKAILIADKQQGEGKLSVIWDRDGFKRENFDSRFVEITKRLIGILQDMYAERLQFFYILHPTWIMKTIFSIFSALLAEKVKQKIKIINNLGDLKNFIEPQNLLVEHGGTSTYVYEFSQQDLEEQEKQEKIFDDNKIQDILIDDKFSVSSQHEYHSIMNDTQLFFDQQDLVQNNYQQSQINIEYDNANYQNKFCCGVNTKKNNEECTII